MEAEVEEDLLLEVTEAGVLEAEEAEVGQIWERSFKTEKEKISSYLTEEEEVSEVTLEVEEEDIKTEKIEEGTNPEVVIEEGEINITGTEVVTKPHNLGLDLITEVKECQNQEVAMAVSQEAEAEIELLILGKRKKCLKLMAEHFL